MNPLTRFGRWLFNVDPEIRETYPVDEQSIKDNKIINELVKKLKSRDAELSRVKADQNLKAQDQQESSEMDNMAEELQRQSSNLKKKRYGGATSLKDIFLSLDKKNYRNKVEITDKNDKRIFGIFGNICVLNNGHLGLQDNNGRILAQGPTMRHIIYKPESLGNQMRRKRILMPCDENHIFYPDIEEIELPETIYDEKEGKIKWATVRKKPLKQLVQEKDEIIRDSHNYIEKIEQDKVDLVNKNRDLERALRVQKNMAENSQSELSKAMDKSIQFEQKMHGLQMRVIGLQEMKNINEKLIDGIKSINLELLEKVQEVGGKTEFTKALDMVQNLMSWAKDKLPETVIAESHTQMPQKPQKQEGGAE